MGERTHDLVSKLLQRIQQVRLAGRVSAEHSDDREHAVRGARRGDPVVGCVRQTRRDERDFDAVAERERVLDTES